MSEHVSAAIAELERMLADQRLCVLAGDFSSLADQLVRIEAFEAYLSSSTCDRAALSRIQRSAERNAALIEASARGIRSVRRRLREIAGAPAPETYTADGRKVAWNGRQEETRTGP